MRVDRVEHLLLLPLPATVEEGENPREKELARPAGDQTLDRGGGFPVRARGQGPSLGEEVHDL